MISDAPNSGPSAETLRALAGMLPQLKRARRGKGKVRVARKFCKICGKLWDFINMPVGTKNMMVAEYCLECDTKLKEGLIAFVQADNYVFARSGGKLDDMKGTVMHVSEHVMAELKRVYRAQVKTKENGGSE